MKVIFACIAAIALVAASVGAAAPNLRVSLDLHSSSAVDEDSVKTVYFIRHAETVTTTTVVGPAENAYFDIEWNADDELSFNMGDPPEPPIGGYFLVSAVPFDCHAI